MPAGNRASDQTLVEQCVQWTLNRIDGQVFRAGMRLPSIRSLARERGVSPFTVVEAYERLVAGGHIEARRGSGFYVRERGRESHFTESAETSRIDLGWLLHHMLAGSTSSQGPGVGVLPAAWLDGAKLGTTLRSLGRQGNGRWLENAAPRGFQPLRVVIQQRLAHLDILAKQEQIVLTTGITHALDLVARRLVRRGGTVLTFDPCWFGTYGVLASHGARVIGVPCTPHGPDLAMLERLVREERPQLLVASSAAQNPTGLSLSRQAVKDILAITAKHDVPIFEDDAYADLCESPITRLAAEDGLDRVIHAGSFSKTLASNIRVGFLACRADIANALADTKILSGFTTPELNERLVHEMLVESRYDNHVANLRKQLAECRGRTKKMLAAEGIEIFGEPVDGLFLWLNMHTDTNELAAAWREKAMLLAPGGLFSPTQTASTWMRYNVTTPVDDRILELFRSVRKSISGPAETGSSPGA